MRRATSEALAIQARLTCKLQGVEYDPPEAYVETARERALSALLQAWSSHIVPVVSAAVGKVADAAAWFSRGWLARALRRMDLEDRARAEARGPYIDEVTGEVLVVDVEESE